MKLIAIAGKKNSGKDTVARYIELLTFNPYEQIKFARKLKDMVSLLIGCDPKSLEDYDFKEKLLDGWGNLNPRILLQEFGSAGRKMYPEIWVQATLGGLLPSSNYIISDCRYTNEAEAVKKLGGVVVRVQRNTNNQDTHSSETGLDDYQDWDMIIDNNGTLPELMEKVRMMCRKLEL
jgi:hypothetical protein